MNPQNAAAAAKTIPAFLNTAIQFCMNHWMVIVICLILLILLIFLIILPVFRKIKQARLKTVETNELKHDLLAWRNIKKLARGGSASDDAKASLSSKLDLITYLFSRGKSLLKELHRKAYDLPSFILLGEPASGKSALLENSQLDSRVSVDEPPKHTPDESVPIRFWATPMAIVVDVSGRILFDRWLNGSGAEWNHIVRLIHNKHGKRPLDGIILTIPVDALLSDEEALVRKKAVLIASEVNKLIRTIGMQLPCTIVITKCDMLPGFREYFSEAEDDFRKMVFGWQNQKGTNFDYSDFSTFFQEAYQDLLDGRKGRILSRMVLDAPKTRRGQTAGELFCFPDNFKLLEQSLGLYLRSLFGSENLHAAEKPQQTGVFFTSAKDTGVCLDKTYAKLTQTSVDEAIIRKGHSFRNSGAFIHSLLKNFVFKTGALAQFSLFERFKRNIPVLLASSILIVLGIVWSFACFNQDRTFELTMKNKASFYKNVKQLFQKGSFYESPLIIQKGNTYAIAASDQTMKDNPHVSQVNFFRMESDFKTVPLPPPPGHRMASLLISGSVSDIYKADRDYLHNEIHMRMFYYPALMLSVKKIVQAPENAEINLATRKLVLELLDALQYKPVHILNWYLTDKFKTLTPSDLLAFLIPEINAGISKRFDTLDLKETSYQMGEQHALCLFEIASMGMDDIISRILKGWSNLSIYPDSSFNQLTKVFANSTRLLQIQRDLQTMPMLIRPEMSEEDILILFRNRANLVQEFLSLWQENANILPQIPARGQNPLTLHAYLQETAQEYMNLMKRDIACIEKFQGRSGKNAEADLQFRQEKIHSAIVDKLVFYTNQEKNFMQLCFAERRENQPHGENFSIGKDGEKLYNIYSFYLEMLDRETPHENDSFLVRWQTNEQRIQMILQQFDAYAQDNSVSAKKYPGLMVSERAALVLAADYTRYQLIHEMLAALPASKNLVSSQITNIEKRGQNRFKSILLDETIGSVSYAAKYDPELISPRMQDLNLLKSLMAPAMEKVYSPLIFMEKDTAMEHLSLFQNYLTSYITYWSDFGETLSMKFKNYQDFKRHSKELRAYHTNTILQEIYNGILEILQQVPVPLLSAKNADLLKKGIEKNNGIVSLLSPHFTETCLRVVANWQALPDDPLKAWDLLNKLTPEQRLLKYQIMAAENTAGNIAWWTAYINSGMEFLRQDVSAARKEKYKNCFSMIARFPLSQDSIDPKPLAADELQQFLEFLPTIGIYRISQQDVKPKSEKKGFELPSLLPDRTLNKEDRQWGNKALIISEALINQEKPLNWTQHCFSENDQKRLCAAIAPNANPAWLRFRYLKIAGDSEDKKLFKTTDAKQSVILAGKINCNSICFFFKKHLEDADRIPDVVFDGDWAILRLYLQKGALFDPETKMVAIPLMLKDDTGIPYVYCIGLSFNKQLPMPSEWPSEKTLPEFSAPQEQLKQMRFSVDDWKKVILQTPAGEDGYNGLLSLLKPQNIGDVPKFYLRVGTAGNDIKKYPILQSYRYASISTEYKRGRRFPTFFDMTMQEKTSVPMMAGALQIDLYEHSNDKLPAETIQVQSPYAILKLLTAGPKKENADKSITLTIKHGDLDLPISISIVK